MFLGVDVGSVSCNFVLIDEKGKVVFKSYERTKGDPVNSIKLSLEKLQKSFPNATIKGVATTGSGRKLAGAVLGADLVKNEITTHATASVHSIPDVKTVLEIGGQDSKIIIIRDGQVVDFAMNTVCAAGTGSFLDQQCGRLGIKIDDFGDMALASKSDVSIAGRCTVFAESDMIHKQQFGAKKEDIIRGLCESLVRNYMNNVGKGKEILEPIVFQGGVAANKGIIKEFEKEIGKKVTVPENFDVMGALGSALLVKQLNPQHTKFKSFNILKIDYKSSSFKCTDCANHCEVAELKEGEKIIARWGDRCGKWSSKIS